MVVPAHPADEEEFSGRRPAASVKIGNNLNAARLMVATKL